MTPYSIQQIKFECLIYIKEFGAQMDQWVMGVTSKPQEALAGHGVDVTQDIWIWKPALSPAAARAVLEFFTCRYQVQPAPAQEGEGSAHCVFMFKKPVKSAGTALAE
jgi:hypothetical protein